MTTQSTTTEPTLEPCPWCPTERREIHKTEGGIVGVIIHDLGCYLARHEDDRRQVLTPHGVTAWNSRVTAPIVALVEPSCWHCGVVLAYAPKLRCEDCPTECDIEGCDELGCQPAPASTVAMRDEAAGRLSNSKPHVEARVSTKRRVIEGVQRGDTGTITRLEDGGYCVVKWDSDGESTSVLMMSLRPLSEGYNEGFDDAARVGRTLNSVAATTPPSTAAKAAELFPKSTYKDKRQLTDKERSKLNAALNDYLFNNCDHDHEGYPNHLACRWCVLEIIAAIIERCLFAEREDQNTQ